MYISQHTSRKQVPYQCDYCQNLGFRDRKYYNRDVNVRNSFLTFCGRSCANAFKQVGIIPCKQCENMFDAFGDKRRKFCSSSCSAIYNNLHRPPPAYPDEWRKALSERQSLNNSGGRCKWFWVGGQHVQGTWERDAGIKLTELGVEWRKCAGKADILVYELDGKTRRYTPDFYLPALDLYIEFKGYWWGDDRRKMDAVLAQHPEKNIVIFEEVAYRRMMANGLPNEIDSN